MNKVQEWRNKTKQKLIMFCGGKCNRCNYDKCYGALDFHHINPDDKEFSISSAISNPLAWNKLIKEVEKCVLLCSNCHRELHYQLWEIKDINHKGYNIEKRLLKKEIITGQCACGKNLFNNHKSCSNKCSGLKQRKCIHPSKEELENMVWKMPTKHVASHYNVTDKSVEKWCKKYNIKKPGVGYWQKMRYQNHTII